MDFNCMHVDMKLPFEIQCAADPKVSAYYLITRKQFQQLECLVIMLFIVGVLPMQTPLAQ